MLPGEIGADPVRGTPTWMIHQSPPAAKTVSRPCQQPVTDAGPEQSSGEGGESGQQRAGGDHEAGPQDRLVPDPSEEQDAAEDQRTEAAEEGQPAEVGQGHGAVADDGRLDDRVGWRNERATSQAPDARPPEGADIRALVQPQSEPLTMAATRLATATDSRPAPSRSDLRSTGRAPLRAGGCPRPGQPALKGRLTRKTQRQLTWTSRPPMGGPNAAAAPPTADHSPMAAPCGPGRRRAAAGRARSAT